MSDFPGSDPKHKGELHRALGVPEGEKIPADKLAAATHSKDPHIQHMANYAKVARGFKKKGRHRMPPASR